MIEVLTTSFNQKIKVVYDKMYLPTTYKLQVTSLQLTIHKRIYY